jgi:hypothetical protein
MDADVLSKLEIRAFLMVSRRELSRMMSRGLLFI